MKIRGYIKDVAVSLVAAILMEVIILPAVTLEDHAPEPTPFEVNLDLSFSMEVKTMR